jgi:hypothetical protein
MIFRYYGSGIGVSVGVGGTGVSVGVGGTGVSVGVGGTGVSVGVGVTIGGSRNDTIFEYCNTLT